MCTLFRLCILYTYCTAWWTKRLALIIWVNSPTLSGCHPHFRQVTCIKTWSISPAFILSQLPENRSIEKIKVYLLSKPSDKLIMFKLKSSNLFLSWNNSRLGKGINLTPLFVFPKMYLLERGWSPRFLWLLVLSYVTPFLKIS